MPLDCPVCARALPAFPRRCPGCGSVFKWVPMAALMSVVLPGWGHFYLGRRWLAAFELAGALVLLFMGIARLFGVFLAVVDERAQIADIVVALIPWLLILAAYSVADGLFTLLVSRRLVIRDDAGSALRP